MQVWFAMHRSDDICIQVRALFHRLLFLKPVKSGSYLNVNIFGMMHGRLNSLWIFIGTVPLCVPEKFDSIIMHNQGDNMLKPVCFGKIVAPFLA